MAEVRGIFIGVAMIVGSDKMFVTCVRVCACLSMCNLTYIYSIER